MYTILSPVDGTDHSLKALHIAFDLAHKYKARVLLFHVLPVNKTADDILKLAISRQFDADLVSALKKVAKSNTDPLSERQLKEIAGMILRLAACRGKRVGIETRILPIAKGNAAENILLAQKLHGSSTIVMGSRGVRGSSLETASVSHAVFAKADCTCIAVK